MYNLGTDLQNTTVRPGTNLLVTGPPMTGKSELAYKILAEGANRDEGTIVVTTKESGESVLSTYQEHVAELDRSRVGVVDCVSKQQGMQTAAQTDVIEYASSPVDMTGIGIKLSEFIQSFYQQREIQWTRTLLNSLSTLLIYSDLQTVFRFLHVFTGRIQSANALGVCVVDSTTHDDQTMSTLKQLFDSEIEIRRGEESKPELRVRGIEPGLTEWQTV